MCENHFERDQRKHLLELENFCCTISLNQTDCPLVSQDYIHNMKPYKVFKIINYVVAVSHFQC